MLARACMRAGQRLQGGYRNFGEFYVRGPRWRVGLAVVLYRFARWRLGE